MRKIHAFRLFAVLCLITSSWATGTTLYVDDDACPATGTGTPADPFCRIQQAAIDAGSGDTIRVLPGTYHECVNTTTFALGTFKNLLVVADDWLVNQDNTTTVIDGTGQCGLPFSAVNLAGSGLPATAGLQGFTVTGGDSSGVFGIGSLAITDNVVVENKSKFGGGVFLYPGTCYYGSVELRLEGNEISRNVAEFRGTCTNDGAPCTTWQDCGFYDCDTGGHGGGVYLDGRAVNGNGYCIGGDAVVRFEDNVFDANDAEGFAGGGLAVLTNTQTSRAIDVVITQNEISGNTADGVVNSYGGGAWLSTFGYGTETIAFTHNRVTGNQSGTDGGGASAWIDTYGDADHDITVDDNVVESNSAGGGGGGLELFMLTNELDAGDRVALSATGNTVTGNFAGGGRDGASQAGGGGIHAWIGARRSESTISTFTLERNRVTGNSSATTGGGLGLISKADAERYDGTTSPAGAVLRVSGNLVAANTTSAGASKTGGGVFAYLEARGEASASIEMQLNTIAGNAAGAGAGGVEIESSTEFDTNGAVEGSARLRLDSSVLTANSGLGLGGPVPGTAGALTPGGTGKLELLLEYNDLFDNAGGDYAGWIVPGSSDIRQDPRLDSRWHLRSGSAAIDAGNTDDSGFPALDIDGEDRILNGRVDIGADEYSGPINEPPVAVATVSETTECSDSDGAFVRLDGTSSTDPDSTPGTHDDIVSFEWLEDHGLPSETLLAGEAVADVTLSLGSHDITLRVTDAAGDTDTATVTAAVVDTGDPTIELALSPSVLRPPNHRMVGIRAEVTAEDACGTPEVTLVSIASSEPDNAPGGGDGNTTNDIQHADLGSFDLEFSLRAERAGRGDGRTYHVVYRVVDASGNSAEGSGVVSVPKGPGARPEAATTTPGGGAKTPQAPD